MDVGILARHVYVERVVGVLDDGDAKALFTQMRNDMRQQRRFAGAAPSRKAYDLHRFLRNRSPFVITGKGLYRYEGLVMLCCRDDEGREIPCSPDPARSRRSAVDRTRGRHRSG